MRLLLAAVAASLLSLPASAHAEEPIKREWYGYQVLIADGATIASTSVLYLTMPDGRLTGENFVAGHLLGAPIVHVVHQNYAAAVGSVLLRAALPYAGAHFWCELNMDGPENYECRSADVVGALAGAFIAGAIDAALFSYAAPRTSRSRRSVGVLPTASLGRHGATFGLQAVF